MRILFVQPLSSTETNRDGCEKNAKNQPQLPLPENNYIMEEILLLQCVKPPCGQPGLPRGIWWFAVKPYCMYSTQPWKWLTALTLVISLISINFLPEKRGQAKPEELQQRNGFKGIWEAERLECYVQHPTRQRLHRQWFTVEPCRDWEEM